MTIKVIGAGFGRTGTMSLKAALEELGFDKCYHMREVLEHPRHVPTWIAAGEGRAVDWDKLFEGYQAIVDWPGCTFYQELMQRYPDAKVLLSVRDPEKWYASALNTIYRLHRTFPLPLMAKLIPAMRRQFKMANLIIWDGTFHGRFTDKQHAIDVFNRHNEEVRRVVPPERLLVYDVKQGWEPLCRFLGVPVPQDKPFPHLNETAEFQQRIGRRAGILRLALGGAVALLALTAGWLALRNYLKRGV